jgi:hypothetical protein
MQKIWKLLIVDICKLKLTLRLVCLKAKVGSSEGGNIPLWDS